MKTEKIAHFILNFAFVKKLSQSVLKKTKKSQKESLDVWAHRRKLPAARFKHQRFGLANFLT